MVENNWQELCTEAIAVVKKAGAFIIEQKQKVKLQDIEHKSLNSLVSYVDKTAEKILVEGLGKILEDKGETCSFLAEEATIERIDDGEIDFEWIIDPLDGTTNFLHNVPPFAVSVALTYQKELVIGIVYELNLDECFYAWKGGGAFLNEQAISVSPTLELKDSLIATGFPYYDFSKLPNYMNALQYFIQNTRGLRRHGSAAVDLCYVASGRFDAFFEYSLAPWDVAAGALIVQEAGGKIFDFKGKDGFLFGKEIIAINANLEQSFTDIIKQYF